jgi:hypothetical protein
MLSQSDVQIDLVSSTILNKGYDVSFIVPTDTAMNKKIMDAHYSLRSFLKKNDIHDYEKQKQGPIAKIEANYVGNNDCQKIVVSMYRPKTKSGDPRVWFYGLHKLANAYNLLALIHINRELYIVNCSELGNLDFALQHILPKPKNEISSTASELLSKLKDISNLGFIPTTVHGDAGVGMTLENLLGISANSSKKPDYKGIELKASRVDAKLKQKNKKQLFSKTPNWKLSPIRTAENLVLCRGYTDTDGYQALRHTISGKSINSRGLFLDIDFANDYLRQLYDDTTIKNFSPEHDMTWLMSDLRKALLTKHKETFWVKALHNNDRTAEKFHYVDVEHTVNPYVEKLETLIETGLITLDYTLHLKASGKARDHGYLFKLKANSVEALFASPQKYDLTL